MKLGQLLVRRGKLEPDALRAVLAKQETEQCWLGESLVRMGLVSKKDILEALQTQPQFVHDLVSLLQADRAVTQLIPRRVAEGIPALGVAREDGELVVAMDDPLDFGAIARLQALTSARVVPVMAERADLLTAIRFHYDSVSTSTALVRADEEELDGLGDEEGGARHAGLATVASAPGPAAVEAGGRITGIERQRADDGEWAEDLPSSVQLQNLLLYQAVRERASDIHIEPRGEHLVVRNRVDGRLVESQILPQWMHAGLISRFKVLAEMDVSERRLPQDGRCRVSLDDREIDLRISTLPTLAGEKMVLRLLDRHNQLMELEELGLDPPQLATLKDLLTYPQGMILVVGPTGSGKTTTLYSLLQRIDRDSFNVVTIEDPVEFELPLITQVLVREKIGLTFAKVLRSVLRQDPDIVLVGEIRDEETAEIATRASVTGHLLFSTLHTNSAVATMVRMLDLGISPFMLSSSLLAIISQRLVRRLCHRCAELGDPDPDLLRILGLPQDGARYLQARGCDECGDRGYRGRLPIIEILRLTEPLREGIMRGISQHEFTRLAAESGMEGLMAAGLSKVRQGLTTLEEVARAVRDPGTAQEDHGGVGAHSAPEAEDHAATLRLTATAGSSASRAATPTGTLHVEPPDETAASIETEAAPSESEPTPKPELEPGSKSRSKSKSKSKSRKA
jgi:type IV pilus assembly protein PilB